MQKEQNMHQCRRLRVIVLLNLISSHFLVSSSSCVGGRMDGERQEAVSHYHGEEIDSLNYEATWKPMRKKLYIGGNYMTYLPRYV